MQDEELEDLPSVDDLAIAARAAAGAPDPVGPVLRQALGEEPEEEDEEAPTEGNITSAGPADDPMEVGIQPRRPVECFPSLAAVVQSIQKY